VSSHSSYCVIFFCIEWCPTFCCWSVLCFLFYLSSYCVLCTQCCQFLWNVHSWLPFRFSLSLVYSWKYKCGNNTIRRVWRHQRGNQNLYSDEEHITQWPKEKVLKDKQRSTKHTYLCHKWPRICSTCRKHFPVLSSFMSYHRVCFYINTTDATSGTRTSRTSKDRIQWRKGQTIIYKTKDWATWTPLIIGVEIMFSCREICHISI
jgi:hypothetical protein